MRERELRFFFFLKKFVEGGGEGVNFFFNPLWGGGLVLLIQS